MNPFIKYNRCNSEFIQKKEMERFALHLLFYPFLSPVVLSFVLSHVDLTDRMDLSSFSE